MDVNLQPPETREDRDDVLVDVIKVWRTIQGEGPYAGMPAVFVRLAGCNLQCRMCDTNYTTGRKLLRPSEVLTLIKEADPSPDRLIVITGGEPFRQNLAPLIKCIEFQDLSLIQIETNGTYHPGDDFPFTDVTIVCSPKTGTINKALQPRIAALKYVLQAGQIDPQDGLPLTTLGETCSVGRPDKTICDAEIYVQPLDEQDPAANARNLAATVESAMKFDYRLCLQIQKLIGLE